jgi:hypothetical protein
MTASILAFRSDPLIPAMQSNGALMQNSHTFTIASA